MPEPIDFIIFAICLRASSSWLTCVTVVPLPAAIRWRREPSIMCGTRRSCGVIERMIASTRPSSLLVDVVEPLELLAHAGDHLQHALERAHPAQHLVALEEVVEA